MSTAFSISTAGCLTRLPAGPLLPTAGSQPNSATRRFPSSSSKPHFCSPSLGATTGSHKRLLSPRFALSPTSSQSSTSSVQILPTRATSSTCAPGSPTRWSVFRRFLVSVNMYHPYPLLRFDIPKNRSCELPDSIQPVSPSPGREGGDGRGGQGVRGLRALCVPAVRDRVLQTAVYLVTRPVFEAEFESSSYAYREGRSVRDAVLRIDQLRRQGFRWLVDADIDSFFDNISH